MRQGIRYAVGSTRDPSPVTTKAAQYLGEANGRSVGQRGFGRYPPVAAFTGNENLVTCEERHMSEACRMISLACRNRTRVPFASYTARKSWSTFGSWGIRMVRPIQSFSRVGSSCQRHGGGWFSPPAIHIVGSLAFGFVPREGSVVTAVTRNIFAVVIMPLPILA